MQKNLEKIVKGQNTIANKIIAAILVVTLTFANFILLGVVTGKGIISYAAENLEGQNSNTQHPNVKFDAYFMKEGVKTHSLTIDSQESTKLYFALNIKEKGYLKNGSIEIKNPNYYITEKLEASEIMQKIENNIIQLKQINYGTEAIVDLPIALEIEDEFLLEKINQESSLILKGIYVTENGEEIQIEKEIKLNVIWTSQNKINLTNQISKYKEYKEAEKVLVQEQIKLTKESKGLPIDTTKIEIQVPEYKNTAPEKIIVQANNLGLTTGEEYEAITFSKENWNYNESTQKLEIEVENKETEGKIWAGLGEDEYTITYIYGKEAIENKQASNKIESKITATITTYNGKEKQENKIESKEEKELEEEIGEIITGRTKIEESSISKGKLYANTNSNNREYETIYHIKQMVEIPYIEETESIIIQGKTEQFIDQEGTKASTKIGGINYTAYTKTTVDSTSLEKILGQDGYIIVKNSSGEEIGKISKENNEIVYTQKQDQITLETSKPVEEGNLIINHEKIIKADLPYLKNQLLTYKQLETGMQIGKSEATATVELKETETKVDMTINKQVINKQENIEIKVELNNTNETTDLYKNPKFTIELPEYIEKAEINKTEILFEEELKIKKAEVIKNEDGKQEIQVELAGTQTRFNTIPNTNGTTIIIQANLTVSKTGEGKAKLQVINENAVNYSKEGNTEAVLNGYVTTYLDITIPNESTSQNNTAVGTEPEGTSNNNTEQPNDSGNEEIEQYLKVTIESNEYQDKVYQPESEYTYSILIENTTPEDIEEELVWSDEDIEKLNQLNARIEEIVKNEIFTEEQDIELNNLYLENIKLSKKYARGEEKEYYEILELKQNKIIEVNQQIIEYQNLKGLDSLTEEQTKKLNELEQILGSYILALDEFNNYLEQLSVDNLTQEQEEKLDELGNKVEEEEEKLKSLSEEQEIRLTELEKKIEDGTITNLDDTTIKNIELKLNLPTYVTYQSTQLLDGEGNVVRTKTIEYDETNHAVILKLEEYPENFTQLYWNIKTTIGDIGEEYIKQIQSVVNLQYEQLNQKIESKQMANLTIGKIGIEIIKTSQGLNEINKVSDEITFKLQIKNIGGVNCYTTKVLFKLPEGLSFKNMYYGVEEDNKQLEENQPTITEEGIEVPISILEVGKTTYAYITTVVEETTEDKELLVEAIVKYKEKQEDVFQEEKSNWNVIVEKTESENNPNDSNDQDNPNRPGTYSISGYAWEDQNKDGIKAQRDIGIQGIKAILVNVNTVETIGAILTDENGYYRFNNVEPGEYQIIFEYNSKDYGLTEYKKTEEEEINSNAIKVENGAAITDVIKVADKNINYINIGLVNIPVFDMSLTKRVSKITVQNAEGTKTYNFNNTELAKVEINGKYINGSTVLVEYKIRVTNEGELAGTVEKIVDYMPKEMTFISDLNSAWVQESDGNLYNTELSKVEINPGETKEVTLVLRKKMTEDNTGTINNRAEITEVSNLSNTEDYDSIPGNKVQGEDDISTADVIIGIKTGEIILYTIITIISLTILGIGIYYINKKVLKRK